MTLTLNPPSSGANAQRGMSLISVLVAIVIFGLGMLSVASLYGLAVPAQTANQEVADTAAFGNQFWAILQANPGLINTIQTNNGGALSITNAADINTAPPPLQSWLTSIFSNTQTLLPGAQVIITTGSGAEGNPCDVSAPTAPICGVKLTLVWNAGTAGGGERQQIFNYQIGY